MLPRPKEFALSLMKKEHIAKDTYSFYFVKSDKELNFLPGQYIRMSFSNLQGSISRFFTIASSPLEEYLVITTKIYAGSSDFKKRLFNTDINEQVKFFGPIGGFIFQDEDLFHHVFLAGGIGITPFHSMITYASQKKHIIRLTLFVSFSTAEEIIYYDELTKLAKENENIKIIYTITNSDAQWKGEIGKISETLIKKYVPDIHNPTYYIVGPLDMVSSTEELLEDMGIELDKIKIEQFTGY